MRLNLKKKLFSTLIVMTFMFAFFNLMFLDRSVNLIIDDNNSIVDVTSLKASYYNLTMSPIVINGSETGVGAHNWSWAANQDWCINKSGILYLENLTINGGGSQSCIEIINSHENFTIKNCTLYNSNGSSREAGIKLVNVSGGRITENNISFNNIGITLVNNNTYNIISKNTISNNTEYGILILNDTAMSIGNFIYRNNFTGNAIHALDNSTYDTTFYYNFWYDAFFKSNKTIKGPGNYWDNYTELSAGAIDLDDDGIGDIPYTIPGTGVAEDPYPIWKDGYDGGTILIDDTAQATHVTWEWASTLDWCNGSGTLADPYTIDKLVIDANNNDDCIKIQNSNVYFKITNCIAFNTLSTTGIKLDNVNLGQVIDNNCSNTNTYGIYLIDCNNITISENNLFNNSVYGIYMYNSNNITLTDNNVTYNRASGISLSSLNNIVIDNNIVSYNYYNGMEISYGTNILLRNCIANNNTAYGIYLSGGSNNNLIENNTAKFNRIGIFIENSDNNDIVNNTAKNNTIVGISISSSIFNEISGNIANYNEFYGITLSSSSNNNTIDSNNMSLNGNGLNLEDSHYNTILNNTSNNNTQYGIYLEASNYNNVTGNSVTGNGEWCIYQYNCINGSNHFEYNGNCTVLTYNDPEPLPPSNGGTPPPFIPGYDIVFLLGTMCLISMIIIKKKRKRV